MDSSHVIYFDFWCMHACCFLSVEGHTPCDNRQQRINYFRLRLNANDGSSSIDYNGDNHLVPQANERNLLKLDSGCDWICTNTLAELLLCS